MNLTASKDSSIILDCATNDIDVCDSLYVYIYGNLYQHCYDDNCQNSTYNIYKGGYLYLKASMQPFW